MDEFIDHAAVGGLHLIDHGATRLIQADDLDNGTSFVLAVPVGGVGLREVGERKYSHDEVVDFAGSQTIGARLQVLQMLLEASNACATRRSISIARD